MMPDLECLLAVLRDSSRTPDFSLKQLQDAFNRAEVEKALPLFLSRLRSSGYPLKGEFELRCVAAEREIATSTFWWTSELKGILQAFAAANITVILLKGPCLAERLYGNAALRLSRDLDLLVRRSDLKVAGDVLTQTGFVRGEDDERHQSWRRASTMIELHFDLANRRDIRMDLDRVFASALPVTFAGQPACVLSPPDELLFLCIHGIKHSYEQLSHIVDVAFALQNLGDRPEFAVCVEDEGLAASVVVLGYAIARKVFAVELPPGLHVESRVAHRIDRIAGSLWLRISERPDTQNLWRHPRRIYFALQPTYFAHIRYLWHIARTISDEDMDLAHELGIKNQQLALLIRPLRLIHKLIRRGIARTHS